jgi:hypothetical protein
MILSIPLSGQVSCQSCYPARAPIWESEFCFGFRNRIADLGTLCRRQEAPAKNKANLNNCLTL